MVPVILSTNFYELNEKIRKEIVNRVTNIEIYDYPLDSAWLLYALYMDEKYNNPFFKQYIAQLERWALSEESGKKNRDLAPLSLCGFLSTKSEVKEKTIYKVKNILTKAPYNLNLKFNVLNDPEQIFCASLLIKNEEDIKSKIVSVIKKNVTGRVSRKVLFIASLIELGENVQDFLVKLETTQNSRDIISLLWLYERYRGIINRNLTDLWKNFNEIYSSVELTNPGKNFALSNRDLALLYEAVRKELTEPDPNMLFDLYPLHPEIKKIAGDYFKNKKYINAVFETTKKLNEFIQNKTGIKDKSEAELVQATMKQIKNLERLVIVFNDYISEDSGKNEQKGLALITEGIFNAFRNPKGHKPEDHPLVNLTPCETLSQLIIIDYMWKRIESAKIRRKDDEND